MATRDVTVLGGGIFGLACAFRMARMGARVRLIERHAIGAGCSGGLVGALAPHVPENWNAKKQFQLESLLMAAEFWAEVEAIGGQSPGYARSGRLQPLADAAAIARAKARAAEAQTLWQGRATWKVIPVTDAPWQPAAPSGYLVHDTLTARASPRAAGRALLAALQALGVDVLLGDAPTQGARQGPTQGMVLHATGLTGLQDLSQSLGKPVGSGVKGQSVSVLHTAPDAPQIFADGLHIVPHADGTVAIGSTSENHWTDGATDAQCDALLEKARTILPVLRDAPEVTRWAGIRPRSKSRAPVLGAWPDRPGHFIANGGFKIGFGMAPKVAETIALLMLEGRDTIPPGFRVEDNL